MHIGLLHVFLFICCSVHVKGWFFSQSAPDPFEDDMTKFELYTRLNDDTYGSGTGQPIGKDMNSMTSSNFNASLPTKFFIHGWFGAGWNWYIREMRREMLKYVRGPFHIRGFSGISLSNTPYRVFDKENCNFIEVDWSAGSVNPNYFTAKRSAQQAGRDVASFIHWLHQNFQLSYSNVHILVHSLGGQAAGAAGQQMQDPKIARISGLDPAQPGFNMSDPNDTLGPEDAQFVDNIHTTLVSTAAMGHVDFYPNGGELGVPVLTWVHSHLQPIYIYTESINGHCSYRAYKCASYELLRNGGCPTFCPSLSSCNQMGYHASPEGAMGSLQLHIKESSPYC